MVGIVAGWSVGDGRAVTDGEVVGDRDGFVVGDEEAEVRLRRRAPGANAGVRSGLQQIGSDLGADRHQSGVLGQPLFVRAPAELCWLQPFGNEALDRPGVEEDVHRLGAPAALGVPLGDVYALDTQLAHELCPPLAVVRPRLNEGMARIVGDVAERLLEEPRHHAGIRAAAGDRRRPARAPRLLLSQRAPKDIIRALLGSSALVKIEALPGLDDGIDVERAELAAEPYDVDRGGID